jgi:hypothetical protein
MTPRKTGLLPLRARTGPTARSAAIPFWRKSLDHSILVAIDPNVADIQRLTGMGPRLVARNDRTESTASNHSPTFQKPAAYRW